MSGTTYLGLVPEDLRKKLNPTDDANGFLGDNSDVASADVQESLDEAEDYVLARIPTRYLELLTRVDGEVLTDADRGARGGEMAFNTSLYPVTGVRLYVDYSGLWDERSASHEMAAAGFTVTALSGAIALTTALTEGQTLVAEYEHTGAGLCTLLKKMVKDLAAAEWGRRCGPDEERFDRYQEWESQVYSDLKRMKEKGDGRLGIPRLDRIRLVRETTVGRLVVPQFDQDGGSY